MAITYTQPINVVQIATKMGTMVSAMGADANAAIMAYNQKKTIKVKAPNGDDVALVPYHAVQVFMKAITTEEATKEDAYCDGGGGELQCVEKFNETVTTVESSGVPYAISENIDFIDFEPTIRVTLNDTEYVMDKAENYAFYSYPPNATDPSEMIVGITGMASNPSDPPYAARLMTAEAGTYSLKIEVCN